MLGQVLNIISARKHKIGQKLHIFFPSNITNGALASMDAIIKAWKDEGCYSDFKATTLYIWLALDVVQKRKWYQEDCDNFHDFITKQPASEAQIPVIYVDIKNAGQHPPEISKKKILIRISLLLIMIWGGVSLMRFLLSMVLAIL